MQPPATLADRLDALADRINRLGLTRIDPERFHAEKSDIAASVRRCAQEARYEPAVRRSGTTTWRPPYDI